MRHRSLRSFAAAAFAGFAALALAAAVPARAEPVKIRAGWIIAPASLIPILFAKEGIAKHNGKSYVLEPIYFRASPLQITAFSAGDIDMAAFGYSSFPLAVLNAGLSDLRIIADEIEDGAKDYYSSEFMVRKDSGINKVEDLKGKTLATNGIGSGVYMAMTAMMNQHGLQEKRDYTVVETPFPTMKAILMDKKADLITGSLPLALDPELRAMAKTLFRSRDAMGRSELSFWTMRASFIEKNRAAVLDFMEDSIRAIRWYIDPANRKEAVEIVAKFMKQPPERFESWLFTKNDWYRDPDLLVDLDALEKNVALVRKLGLVKTDLDVKKYSDLSLVKEAAQRIK
jgi:NitT/TauT family transport system substrate-binding protein